MANEVAKQLGCRLELALVRKLGVPWQSELAFGALAENGVKVLNDEMVASCGITPQQIIEVIGHEQTELLRLERLYQSGRHPMDASCKHIIIVDDGIATGSTMRASIARVKMLSPLTITVAVPIAAADAQSLIARDVDIFVCLHTLDPFNSVGDWYEDFKQTEDSEVQNIISSSVLDVNARKNQSH